MEIKQVRRTHTAEFKSKVALEALSERYTVSELCSKYNLHPNLVNGWKKELKENSKKIFLDGNNRKKSVNEQLTDDLYKEIGKLKMKNEWFKKKFQL